MCKNFLSLCLFFFVSTSLPAQLVQPPSGDNQICEVTQYLGSLAKVSVKYNSPGVRGRTGKIWGDLVPWGLAANNFGTAKEMPWRAGANENTVFTFSHDMQINGKPLKAGSYGFHIIPRQNQSWVLIFSKNHTAWGSYFYDPKDDALRVEVAPQPSEFKEWLTYEFTERKPDTTTIALMWENIKVPIQITLPNSADIYVGLFKNEIENYKGFYWQNIVEAVNYCVQYNTHLDQALVWADYALDPKSVGERNFSTLSAKAAVLDKLNRKTESNTLMEEAIKHPSANVNQVHAFAKQLLASGMKEKAMSIFQYNYDTNKGAWPSTIGMARGLSGVGKYDEAIKYAEMGLKQAPDDVNRNFIMAAIEKLKNKQDMN